MWRLLGFIVGPVFLGAFAAGITFRRWGRAAMWSTVTVSVPLAVAAYWTRFGAEVHHGTTREVVATSIIYVGPVLVAGVVFQKSSLPLVWGRIGLTAVAAGIVTVIWMWLVVLPGCVVQLWSCP